MGIDLRDKLTLNWVNRDGRLIMLSRGLCTFAQSAIAIIIALYLEKLGFNLTQVGAFLSAGVAGSAFFAFIVGLTAEKIGRKRLLIVFTLLPATTGMALVFIDGSHRYKVVIREVRLFLEKLTFGGVIFLHDTYPPEEWGRKSGGQHCGSVYKVRQKLEEDSSVWTFTWPYTAMDCGLTMVMKKETNVCIFRR